MCFDDQVLTCTCIIIILIVFSDTQSAVCDRELIICTYENKCTFRAPHLLYTCVC